MAPRCGSLRPVRARPGGCEQPRPGSRAPTRPGSGSRRRGSRRRASAAAPAGRRRSRRSTCRPRPPRSEAERPLSVRSSSDTCPRTYQSPLTRRRTGDQDRIRLVDDLAHDLLDDVLDRDDPGRAAVFVGHHGQRGPLPLEIRQQVVERLGLGNDRNLAHHRLDRRLGALASSATSPARSRAPFPARGRGCRPRSPAAGCVRR